MSGQNTLVIIAEDAQVKRPSHLYNWQIFRNTAAAGSGVYKAMDMNGVVEIIGGPGAGSGIPFGNDTNILPNEIQVAIPGATLTDGYTFEVNILTTNTGATTLQTNALGVKDVVDSDGNPLVGNELINESIYLFVYDLQNDRYQLLGLAKPSEENNILEVKVPLTANQIKTGNSIPILAVASPGVGKALEYVSGSFKFVANTTPFTSTVITITTDTALSEQGADSGTTLSGGLNAFNRIIVVPQAGSALIEDKALTIKIDSDSVVGDGTADVYIAYRVINL